MSVFKRLCSRNLFFTIFNVVQRPEEDSNETHQEHVSLRGDRKHKLFKPYTDSGEITGYNFPFVWSPEYFCATTKS